MNNFDQEIALLLFPKYILPARTAISTDGSVVDKETMLHATHCLKRQKKGVKNLHQKVGQALKERSGVATRGGNYNLRFEVKIPLDGFKIPRNYIRTYFFPFTKFISPKQRIAWGMFEAASLSKQNNTKSLGIYTLKDKRIRIRKHAVEMYSERSDIKKRIWMAENLEAMLLSLRHIPSNDTSDGRHILPNKKHNGYEIFCLAKNTDGDNHTTHILTTYFRQPSW